jgi:homospermidine synthase
VLAGMVWALENLKAKHRRDDEMDFPLSRRADLISGR